MNSKQTGRIAYIGLRPVKSGEVISVSSAMVQVKNGFEGDHYEGRSGKRQLTLILEDQLTQVIDQLPPDSVRPEQTRRNLLVSGLSPEVIRIGDFWKIGSRVMIEITGTCPPCDKMNKTIGPGARDAMENRGGFTARIQKGGEIRLNDSFESTASSDYPGTAD